MQLGGLLAPWNNSNLGPPLNGPNIGGLGGNMNPWTGPTSFGMAPAGPMPGGLAPSIQDQTYGMPVMPGYGGYGQPRQWGNPAPKPMGPIPFTDPGVSRFGIG